MLAYWLVILLAVVLFNFVFELPPKLKLLFNVIFAVGFLIAFLNYMGIPGLRLR